MPKSFKRCVIALPVIMFGLIGSAAIAQSYPEPDEHGLMAFGSWEPVEEGIGGSVRTDSEGGWTQLSVERFSSMGIALDSLEFTVAYGVYEPTRGQFSRLINKSVNNRVRLITDSEIFTSASASYSFNDDANELRISMAFTPMEDDDGVLDLNEPNCQVVSALRNAHQISVIFPDNSGASVESLTLSGRGSSAALADVC